METSRTFPSVCQNGPGRFLLRGHFDAYSVADFDPWREIYPEGHAEPCRLDPATLGDDGWALESWLEDVGTATEAGTAGVSVSLALADED